MKPIYSRTIEKAAGFQFARWSAGAKAFDDLLPPSQRVISDPLAKYYAGKAGMKMVGMMQMISPSIRKAIVLRARYFDDQAQACLRNGCRQVVLLGAGYDSRFLRLKEFRQVRLFEVDLNSTQVIKKALTRRLCGGLPRNVTYVAADLSRNNLIDKLVRAGFRSHEKTLFIWEGVTLFLNRDIIEQTLGKLADLGPDHRVLFDFVPPDLTQGETGHGGNRRLLQLCADIQEPLTFGCTPADMGTILRGVGYSDIEIIGMRQANRIYCGSSDIENDYFFASAKVAMSSDAPPTAEIPRDGWVQSRNSNLLVPQRMLEQ